MISGIDWSTNISIHAPAGGAFLTNNLLSSDSLFQFTPLREGLFAREGKKGMESVISIHAPAGGAF